MCAREDNTEVGGGVLVPVVGWFMGEIRVIRQCPVWASRSAASRVLMRAGNGGIDRE